MPRRWIGGFRIVTEKRSPIILIGCDERDMIHQLRIYEIFDQNKQAFHERFRDHAWRSCDPTGSTSSARGRQGWETGQSSSTYSPGRMRRQCDTPGTSSGPTKSGKRSRKSRMLDTATLSEKSSIECSPRQAIVPLSMRHVSQATLPLERPKSSTT